MNNYSGHEYIGSRYESGLSTTEIAKRVRAYLKKRFPGWRSWMRITRGMRGRKGRLPQLSES